MLEPSALIDCITETCAPEPTATASVTANTPIITPSVVRIERIKLVRRAVMAIATLTSHAALFLARRPVMR